MSEKRFRCVDNDVQFGMIIDGEVILANPSYVINLLNSLSDDVKHLEEYSADLESDVKRLTEEISYWKHRVSSLLMILSQFDNEKVKKLLEELEDE